jgi:hypothetical protein
MLYHLKYVNHYFKVQIYNRKTKTNCLKMTKPISYMSENRRIKNCNETNYFFDIEKES